VVTSGIGSMALVIDSLHHRENLPLTVHFLEDHVARESEHILLILYVLPTHQLL
jgi:hypothetical protein